MRDNIQSVLRTQKRMKTTGCEPEVPESTHNYVFSLHRSQAQGQNHNHHEPC